MTIAKVYSSVECLKGTTKEEIDQLFDLLPGKRTRIRKENSESKRVLNDLKWVSSMNLIWEAEDRKELKKDIECLKWFLGER